MKQWLERRENRFVIHIFKNFVIWDWQIFGLSNFLNISYTTELEYEYRSV